MGNATTLMHRAASCRFLRGLRALRVEISSRLPLPVTLAEVHHHFENQQIGPG
jgi:hypothetical protein